MAGSERNLNRLPNKCLKFLDTRGRKGRVILVLELEETRFTLQSKFRQRMDEHCIFTLPCLPPGRSHVSVIIPMDRARVGVLQQGAPTEDRDVDLPLNGAGEGLHPGALQHHRPHVGMGPVEFDGDVKFENVQITPIDSEEAGETGEQRTIVFSPNGTAQSAVIQIGDGKNHYTTSICAATGRAKMEFGTAKEAKTGTIDLDEQ